MIDTLKSGLILLVFMALGGCQPESAQPGASLVVTNARVWTGDPDRPWAGAVASRGEWILAVGNREDIEPYVQADTTIVDASGGMLVPGLIDTHVHFITGGSGLAAVQLRDAATPDEFVRRIATFAETLQPGEWILNGNWDHEMWGGDLPRRDWIDAVTGENPVWINRLDGHMALANSLALELAGVDADSPDVPGGEVVRDQSGSPTGILKDNAMGLVQAVVPEPGEEMLDRQAAAAMAHVASNGVTSVHDMASWDSLATYRRAKARGELHTRIYSVMPLDEWQSLRDEVDTNGRGDRWLRIGGLKGFMDGSLGSHTAAFFDPFTDAPDDRGILINDLHDMRSWIDAADEAGLHVMVHAIGDRAIRRLLDIYHDIAKSNGPRDRRFRIEHAQHIHPEDIERFRVQDIVASMQPYHAIDDGRWADRVIGKKRAETTYAFRSLLDTGAHLAFGSDWFVAPATPLEGIYAAVTRRTLDGSNPNGWVPQQKITVEQALRAYTSGAAYASFEEDIKGRLKPGMLADFVLLDRDITAIPPAQIANTKVLKTVVGGRIVFSSD